MPSAHHRSSEKRTDTTLGRKERRKEEERGEDICFVARQAPDLKESYGAFRVVYTLSRTVTSASLSVPRQAA
jgi:hypothetical protein